MSPENKKIKIKITKIQGVGAPRFFTERECCRLMGFPEWFQFVPPEDEGPSDHQALQRTDVLTPESVYSGSTKALLRLY